MAKTNNIRKFPDGTSPRPDKTESKKDQASERQEYYDGLTVERKLQKLDQKLGEGIGAKKQRTQFASLLEKNNKDPLNISEVIETLEEVSNSTKIKAKDRRKNEQK